jgi:predicted signal transduction protein with EAL and GGDEF domain
MTISAGVSVYPDHGVDADTLLKSADLALYEAKAAGRNVYRIAQRRGPPAAEHGQPDHSAGTGATTD